MTWIDLGNPSPKLETDRYTPYEWDNSKKCIILDDPNAFIPIPFTEVMFKRKSQRYFKTTSIEHLSYLLWLTNRVKDQVDSTMGFPLTLRPVPSAGAIHPIHILLNSPNMDTWWRYDPFSHSLKSITKEHVFFHTVRESCQDILNCNTASIMLLVAEPQKTLSKYSDGASLVWRDAGVLLGNLALAATYLDINFCPLGALFPKKINDGKQLVTVGMSVIDAINIECN
ncbi:SagB family peptide dehydrogenase [Acinetobacter dispersus]|uniref:Nitroreductase domain-containing protein n=1 Tax=Acinetobacter dispersus TaxID=70348 RepID=N9LCW3_9GAMM|nr:SagB family peptide dehydrogenase [Acinetobacter dispersus]ENW94083.1 hypothetical protein F904_00998 [Acinetobacter dispersus]